MDVDFALDVHEHQATCKADGDHHQLGPERPFQDPYGTDHKRDKRNESNTDSNHASTSVQH